MDARKPPARAVPFASAVALALLWAAGLAAAQEPVEPLEGLDPVLLTEGKEADGDPAITLVRGGYRYAFAGEETRARFAADPERYEIQMGGLCARMGGTVEGNPHLFHVHQGSIYLFGTAACRDLFVAAPEAYLEPPAPAPLASRASAEALAAGRALLDRAVEAMGGAARLDAVSTFRAVAVRSVPTPAGPREVKTEWTFSFPGRFRREDAMPFGRLASVVAPEAAFSTFDGGGAEAYTPAQRRSAARDFGRHLVALLKARREGGFAVARAGAGKAGETAVERVEVETDGALSTLRIDAATGRILSLAYLGRNGPGQVGEIVERFSDFRAVGGLTLPFATTATWNGEALAARSFRLESVAVDEAVPAALFAAPVAEGPR